MKQFNNICGHNICIEDDVIREFKKIKYRELDLNDVYIYTIIRLEACGQDIDDAALSKLVNEDFREELSNYIAIPAELLKSGPLLPL